MAEFKKPVGPGSSAIGAVTVNAYVLDVDVANQRATLTTQLHNMVTISLAHLPGKGSQYPAVGETWLITQMYGGWSFVYCVSPPSLRGPTSKRPANPSPGQTYYDETIHHLIWANESGWVEPLASLPPSGPAGGALSGSYPNPGLAAPYYEEVLLPAQVITTGSTQSFINLTAHVLTGTSAFNLTTGVWTCPATGVYSFSMGFGLDNWVSGSRMVLMIMRNGTSLANALVWQESAPAVSGAIGASASRTKQIATGDTIVFRMFQGTGASRTVALDELSYINVALVR